MQDCKDDVHFQEHRRLDIISGEISKRHMLLSHNPDSIISLSPPRQAGEELPLEEDSFFYFFYRQQTFYYGSGCTDVGRLNPRGNGGEA
ncbi:hypothetical protein CDAR_481851 [Caerostris darwini]|uniref:FHA domain-containing protein n=1 Tax=Caerostris darwini TaxID=1538125 RepID=A0AAV4VUU5_9ARAC|nr:hypothetical protein CDAR_481851 [Caerostris darwini]